MTGFDVSKYADAGLLLIRCVLGPMFLYYGLPKLMAGPGAWREVGSAVNAVGIFFWPVFWGFLASVVMAAGGLCVLTGIFFRPACFFLFLVMAVAASMHFSKGQGLMAAAHAIEDGAVFLGLVFVGPGRWVMAFWPAKATL
ncbi:MAG: DoxX family protein [Candidatus Omnitrophota bacterium]